MIPEPGKPVVPCFTLPAWWVRAYDAASISKPEDIGAWGLSRDSALAPAFSTHELNGLAVIIDHLQEQILASDGSTRLCIEPTEFLRRSGSVSKSRKFAFERVLQQLSSLKIMNQDGPNGWCCESVFRSDVWLLDDDDRVMVELELGSLGAEFLSGYCEAFQDLLRTSRGQVPASSYLGPQAPLALWRSIWLELSGVEQALFLRLERSMQWSFSWLQLDGVFGETLASLFHRLQLPPSRGARGAQADSFAVQCLKILSRLGRRLRDHGFLTDEVCGQYYAVGPGDGDDPQLVWQVSEDRLYGHAGSRMAEFFMESQAASLQEKDLDALLRLFGGGEIASVDVAACRDFLEKARELPALIRGLSHGESQFVSPGLLFVELYIRTQKHAALELPELSWFDLRAVLEREPFGHFESVERFYAVLSENPDLVHWLRRTPMATLSSPISQSEPRVRSMLDIHGSIECQSSAPEARRASGPRLIMPVEECAPEGIGKEKGLEQEMPPQKSAALDDFGMDSTMRRIATEELEKMRRSSPERYKQLQKSYLSSLDEQGQRLVLDVQKRMQPGLFEQHLKQRLVRFMVEHPGAWRTSSAQGRP